MVVDKTDQKKLSATYQYISLKKTEKSKKNEFDDIAKWENWCI